jgi:hypothetical protein
VRSRRDADATTAESLASGARWTECYNLEVVQKFPLGRQKSLPRPTHVGEWLSLVEHLVRDQGVGGSNPLSPTIFSQASHWISEGDLRALFPRDLTRKGGKYVHSLPECQPEVSRSRLRESGLSSGAWFPRLGARRGRPMQKTLSAKGMVSLHHTPENMLYSIAKMTIKTKSMMRRRVNRARPSGLVCP